MYILKQINGIRQLTEFVEDILLPEIDEEILPLSTDITG